MLALHRLTTDHAHVLLDALEQPANYTERASQYQGDDTDPKTTAEGYGRLQNESIDAVRNAMDETEGKSGLPDGDQLSQFTRGYVSAMFWANTMLANGENDDANVGDWDRLDHWAWLEVITDCTNFVTTNYADLLAYAKHRSFDPTEGTVWDYAGHDFALTRNGHGAGFWDRGLGELGDRLSDAARVYGSQNFVIGEDGAAGVL
jgi:hypothetical protein